MIVSFHLIVSIHLQVAKQIYHFAITYYRNGFILFGGNKGLLSKKISRFDLTKSEWTNLGDLQTARDGHGVIFDNGIFVVIGGKGNFANEKCILSGNEFSDKEEVINS